MEIFKIKKVLEKLSGTVLSLKISINILIAEVTQELETFATVAAN